MTDRILYNGNIITHDPKHPRVTALAISGGRVVAAGFDADILELATRHTVRENLRGETVVPGLTDAHIHFSWTARTLREVDVFEAPSKQVIIARVAERAAQLPPDTWIIGQGWTQEAWEDKRFPTAQELDAATTQHPVYLRSKSVHSFWVNSRALEIVGINADTPDPEGGRIGRYPDGRPDGMLYENAARLVTPFIPSPSTEEIADMMAEAQKLALAAGLTGLHDFDGPDCLRALQVLKEREQLHMRVVKNINHEWIDHAQTLGIRWGFGDDWLRIGHLKMFADGALGPRTALMIEPYRGEPNNYGVRVMPKAEMQAYVSTASRFGIPSAIHAIGDQAVRDVLDIYEAVRREETARGETHVMRRHRIEHVQVIHPDDIPRMRALSIIASMQPLHATSDYQMSDAYWGARSEYAYNARVQIDQGIVTAFGSDSPVEPFDPLRGIHAAVTRQRPDGSPQGGWYPHLRLSVDEAVRGYTVGAAYAAGMETRLGRLAAGYWADLVVLDHDIYKIEAESLLETQVLATMVGGEWRFGGV